MNQMLPQGRVSVYDCPFSIFVIISATFSVLIPVSTVIASTDLPVLYSDITVYHIET